MTKQQTRIALAVFALSASPLEARFPAWEKSPSSAVLAASATTWSQQALRGEAEDAEWIPFRQAIEPTAPPQLAFAGRINALSIESSPEGDRIFAGSSSGGLWVREVDGAWRPLTDRLPGSPSVGDFLRLADGSMVIATGDPWRYRGTGIYRGSADGLSWETAELPLIPSSVYRLAQDRNAPDRLFAATANGLLESIDGGRRWVLLDPGHYTDLQQDLANPQVWHGGRYGDGIVRSVDGGRSFVRVPGAAAVLAGDIGRTSITLSPARNGLMFALVATFGHTNGIFRSEDGGTTWTTLTAGLDVSWGQAFHTNAIAAHPSNPDVLAVAQGGFKLTNNALATETVWTDLDTTGHADTTRLAWRTDGRLYAANDGGLFLLDPLGAVPTQSLNTGLALQQVFGTGALTLDPNLPGRLWIGTQDNGLVRMETQPLPRLVLGGGCCDGAWVSAARTRPNKIAAGLGIPFGRYVSMNAGNTFSHLGCITLPVTAEAPLAYDPQPMPGTNPRLFVLGQTAAELPRLAAYDDSRTCGFTTFGINLPPDDNTLRVDFLSIAADPGPLALVISPSEWSADRRLTRVSTATGARNGPFSALRVEPPVARSGRAAYDPSHRQQLYWWPARDLPGIWRNRNDELSNWQDISGDLGRFGDGMRIRRVLAHPLEADLLLAATNLGVLKSVDGGQHWQRWHAGLPEVIDAVDIAVDARTTPATLWLGSYGRGLWQREWVSERIFASGFE